MLMILLFYYLCVIATTQETCIYGKCYYCKPEDPVCTKSERLEGAAIFYLPPHIKLKQHLHPWRRTYNEDKKARLEILFSTVKLLTKFNVNALNIFVFV